MGLRFSYVPAIQQVERGMPSTCRDNQRMLVFFDGNFDDVYIIPMSTATNVYLISWWRHEMETFSVLLAICAGNSPVPGEFPAHRPVTRSFDVFFDLRLNKRLSKQSWGWWFEMLSRPLWRHCHVCKCFGRTKSAKSSVNRQLTNFNYDVLFQIITLHLNLKPEYSRTTRSILQLLMPWLLASPGYQQQWYWSCRMNGSLFVTWMDVDCVTSVLKNYRKCLLYGS